MNVELSLELLIIFLLLSFIVGLIFGISLAKPRRQTSLGTTRHAIPATGKIGAAWRCAPATVEGDAANQTSLGGDHSTEVHHVTHFTPLTLDRRGDAGHLRRTLLE